MLIFTAIIIGFAVVICLALAASASPVTGSVSRDASGDDENVMPLNMVPKSFKTTHDGVTNEHRPLVSAAGLQ